MRMTAFLCLAPLLATVASGAARAQPVPPNPAVPPALVAVLNQPDHEDAMAQAAQAVPGACPNAEYLPANDIEVLVPFAAGTDGRPTAGVWRESLTETGCGPQRTINTLTMVQPGGALITRPLLPGTTITDPQLQRDSVRYAAAALGPLPPGCSQGAVVDTEFLGEDGAPPGLRPAPGAPPRPWSERWTLQACTRRVPVMIHFTPDANGGTEIQAAPPAP